jgi:hypothetical protein
MARSSETGVQSACCCTARVACTIAPITCGLAFTLALGKNADGNILKPPPPLDDAPLAAPPSLAALVDDKNDASALEKEDEDEEEEAADKDDAALGALFRNPAPLAEGPAACCCICCGDGKKEPPPGAPPAKALPPTPPTPPTPPPPICRCWASWCASGRNVSSTASTWTAAFFSSVHASLYAEAPSVL